MANLPNLPRSVINPPATPSTPAPTSSSKLTTLSAIAVLACSAFVYTAVNDIKADIAKTGIQRSKAIKNELAFRGTDCYKCHVGDEKNLLPMRRSLSKFQFQEYVRGRERQGAISMPVYQAEQISDSDLNRIYSLLWSEN